MKVLLIGEFSGFHVNLKQGLQKLGVDCVLAANGDGWKKIDGADLPLYHVDTSSLWKKTKSLLIEPFLRLKSLYGYDVVQFMDPQMYHPFVNRILFRAIKRHNKKVFVSVPGSCFSLYKAYKEGKLGYYIYDDNPELCRRYESKTLNKWLQEKDERYIYRHSTGVIPIMYEYAVGVRHHKNCTQTIPLPFDADEIAYKPNVVGDKVVIYHGLIREKDKGSQYIKDALKIIQEKYPDQVEIVVKDKMPLKEYLAVLERTNILIDQCKEHCWGMNACYAMALGKIVLGGASENSLKEFGLEASPIVHIEPNVEQIVSQIEMLLQKKQEFEKMGEESRRFVETFHNSERIAQQYLSVWESQGG